MKRQQKLQGPSSTDARAIAFPQMSFDSTLREALTIQPFSAAC
jgi:hypothetical protein